MALRWDVIANVACPGVDDSGLVGKVRLIFLYFYLAAGTLVKIYQCYFYRENTEALFNNVVTHLSHAQVLVLDGRGHLLGRLSAIVAKQLLLGKYCYRRLKTTCFVK